MNKIVYKILKIASLLKKKKLKLKKNNMKKKVV